MSATRLVTDDDLTRARVDPAFRHQIVVESLELLLGRLNKMRSGSDSARQVLQVREAVELAVRLAELLQRIAHHHPGGPVPDVRDANAKGAERPHSALPFGQNAL
jgi:hypothetical protein